MILRFDSSCKKDLSIKTDYNHSRNMEVSISCSRSAHKRCGWVLIVFYSGPGSISSSIKNPTKSSDSVSVRKKYYCLSGWEALTWTIESFYIQGNRTEIWVRLTILRTNFNPFLWTETPKAREYLSNLLHLTPTIIISSCADYAHEWNASETGFTIFELLQQKFSICMWFE